ncbi:magnesium transporter [Natronobacterium gregoryi]|uniref:Magnesium transporter MgtE n=2 Tax=Natronobacterium gregoryi TaxID=44930 RepID=L0AH02_NATGS|nr:magnesium transporter [Natronobacterium gregoryi]AFZ72447.1 Mg2+ transporter MgtE [Natronobacterium gregoryi SP2]ELY74318.1 MgtE integral membrane protein [Natronobacterium gregoryi SP2]PLK21420.1 magnesium transporter [Natronobacterium gregoryi SP2]SFI78356.1 magnesium transporter [Natronobacterium gregoryi]
MGAASGRDLEFHADRAAEITDDEYVAVTQDTFVGPAIEKFREFDPTAEETTVYYLYVTDNSDRLVGVMSLRELLNAPEDDVVEEHMVTDLVTIDGDADPEYAADEIVERDFPAMPVVDDDGVLVGVLRTDDMIEVVEEEATEDILKSAGFSFADVEKSRSSAILESSIPRILRLRLPWLIVALAGGLLAGGVIEHHEETLEGVVALAFFVPVIMDMGGNVGTQASTIFVRGLALGQIDDRNAVRHFAREGLIGLLIGLIIGAIGAVAAYVWQIDEPYAFELATVVFVGLVAVCVVASVVGYVIPWLMNKLGFDPAAASDPLITTVKDVTALLIYFGLAAILLAELL